MSERDYVFETTAGEVAAELARRGIRPDERVRVMNVDTEAQRPDRPKLADIAARMRATATMRGLTTEIFDALIAQP